MASQRTRRATVRVEVPGKSGTGFVVCRDRRLVLTARHCIECATGVTETVKVYFTDPDSDPRAVEVMEVPAKVIASGARSTDDWALLELQGTLPSWTVTQLPLFDVSALADRSWTSYGYPLDGGDGPTRGTDFKGTIRMGGILPGLLDETAAGKPIAGLSGGPAVLDECVVGIITRAETTLGGFSTTGRIYLLPIGACGELARMIEIHHEPAFLDATAFELAAGRALRSVVQSVCGSDDRLPIEHVEPHRHLALWLLRRQRLEGVPRVMVEVQLSASSTNDVINYAASQWYPRASAAEAAEHLRDGAAHAFSVQCANNDCAVRFMRRAGFEREGSLTWHEGGIVPSWLPYMSADDLIQNIRQVLATLLSCDPDPATVCARMKEEMALAPEHRFPPCWFVVLPEATPADKIEPVRQALPDLAIVVLGPLRNDTMPAVTLDAAEARRQDDALTRVRARLSRSRERSAR